MSETPNPAAIDQTKPHIEENMSQHMDSIMAEVQTMDVPDTAKADILADHFVGGILRVSGGNEEIASRLNYIGKNAGSAQRDTEDGKTGWLDMFTRKEGVRKALLGLDNDPLGKMAIGTFDRKLAHDKNGKVVMTNLDQISGYLAPQTTGEKNLSKDISNAFAWKDAIANEVLGQLTIPNRKAAWTDDSNLESEIEGVRANQKQWKRAVDTATEAGLDIDLITRSAEYIQEQAKNAGHDIGSIALLGVGGGDTYDHLV